MFDVVQQKVSPGPASLVAGMEAQTGFDTKQSQETRLKGDVSNLTSTYK